MAGGPTLVRRKGGVLVLDDSTLDKPYAKKMELVTRHCAADDSIPFRSNGR